MEPAAETAENKDQQLARKDVPDRDGGDAVTAIRQNYCANQTNHL